MSTILNQKRLGDVPAGLSAHHREFLIRIKEAIEILTGSIKHQNDSGATPLSQAVTYDFLINKSIINADFENVLDEDYTVIPYYFGQVL